MTESAALHASKAQIAAWVAQAERQEATARALQGRIESLWVERWSPQRELRIVVDHSGLVRDVEFTDGAMRLGPNTLSRLVMTTVRAARATLRESVVATAAEVGGQDGTLARSLSDEYRKVFTPDGPAPDPDPLFPPRS